MRLSCGIPAVDSMLGSGGIYLVNQFSYFLQNSVQFFIFPILSVEIYLTIAMHLQPLSDAYGLLMHTNGQWEWTLAPGVSPSPRYQHAAVSHLYHM